jgi:co-chaperonin GroES (HSP10)
MMKLVPKSNRILLKIEPQPQSFAGGQLLFARVPDGDGYYAVDPQVGVVLEVGPNVQDVKVGDRVVCTKYNGIDMPREFGEKTKLIREDFVLCGLDDYSSLQLGPSLVEHPTREEFYT